MRKYMFLKKEKNPSNKIVILNKNRIFAPTSAEKCIEHTQIGSY